MSNIPISVVELPQFLRQAASIWDEGEHAEFVDYIARHSESGDVIPDTGGVRKVRWRRQGSGKRGGTRVIYVYYDPRAPLYLIQIYAKAQREDMTSDQKKLARSLAAILKPVQSRKG